MLLRDSSVSWIKACLSKQSVYNGVMSKKTPEEKGQIPLGLEVVVTSGEDLIDIELPEPLPTENVSAWGKPKSWVSVKKDGEEFMLIRSPSGDWNKAAFDSYREWFGKKYLRVRDLELDYVYQVESLDWLRVPKVGGKSQEARRLG